MHADEASQTGEGVSWRQAPSDFGIGGRYPVKEVFSAAYEAWKGVRHTKWFLCCQFFVAEPRGVRSSSVMNHHCIRSS